jgi:NAD(P)-dependent dehydrogenase (short-subunit alcohol dehydrogenase family)
MAATFIDLSGRVSVITGGSRGIGAAAALELARAGSAIALFDLDGEEASAAAGAIAAETGCKARGYAVDVRKSEVLKRMCDAVAEDFGGLDHLVNNAGVQFVAPIAEFPDEKWDFVTSINLDGGARPRADRQYREHPRARRITLQTRLRGSQARRARPNARERARRRAARHHGKRGLPGCGAHRPRAQPGAAAGAILRWWNK